MPIYEFECRKCGHRFDHLQKVSAADPTVCPSCHAEQLHRLLSAPTFRLAGTGWYETDFKKPGDQRHNLAGDAGAPASETKSGADSAGTGKDAVATPAASPSPPPVAAGKEVKTAAPSAGG